MYRRVKCILFCIVKCTQDGPKRSKLLCKRSSYMNCHISFLHLYDHHKLIVIFLGRSKIIKVTHHMQAHMDLRYKKIANGITKTWKPHINTQLKKLLRWSKMYSIISILYATPKVQSRCKKYLTTWETHSVRNMTAYWCRRSRRRRW